MSSHFPRPLVPLRQSGRFYPVVPCRVTSLAGVRRTGPASGQFGPTRPVLSLFRSARPPGPAAGKMPAAAPGGHWQAARGLEARVPRGPFHRADRVHGKHSVRAVGTAGDERGQQRRRPNRRDDGAGGPIIPARTAGRGHGHMEAGGGLNGRTPCRLPGLDGERCIGTC